VELARAEARLSRPAPLPPEHFQPANNMALPHPQAPADIRKTLATNLRIRAAEVDVNQRETAERANISERHLSQIMNCKASPTIDVIAALALALNTSPAALLTPRSGL
jgi:transcriptional regulator with XRE-family HTH domain